MAKYTITIEDMPGGGIFILGDPTIAPLDEQAAVDGQLGGAAGYAAAAWSLLVQLSDAAGPRVQAWTGERPH